MSAELAVGGWSCSCGVTKWHNVTSAAGITLSVRCEYCGDEAEICLLLAGEGTP